jgi:hypothetical protein
VKTELDSLIQRRLFELIVERIVTPEFNFGSGFIGSISIMSQLKLELPEETFLSIVATAKKFGMSAEEWAVRRLRALSLTDEERKAAKERILKYAGSCESVGDLSGEAIDRDLAAEYSATHEAK